MTAGHWTGRGRHRLVWLSFPHCGRWKWSDGLKGGQGPDPSPFPSREGVVMALMEADKGGRKGLGRGKEEVESLIAGRKEGKKPKKIEAGRKSNVQAKVESGQDSRQQVLGGTRLLV